MVGPTVAGVTSTENIDTAPRLGDKILFCLGITRTFVLQFVMGYMIEFMTRPPYDGPRQVPYSGYRHHGRGGRVTARKRSNMEVVQEPS